MYRNTKSRTLNPARLTPRSVKVPFAPSGYVTWMRYFGLALVTAVFVVILAASAHPVPSTKAAELETPAQSPHWSETYAAAFPGCVGTGDFIPARIVVVPREGDARTMPYSDATVARIDATWDNEAAADDLFTVGKCAR